MPQRHAHGIERQPRLHAGDGRTPATAAASTARHAAGGPGRTASRRPGRRPGARRARRPAAAAMGSAPRSRSSAAASGGRRVQGGELGGPRPGGAAPGQLGRRGVEHRHPGDDPVGAGIAQQRHVAGPPAAAGRSRRSRQRSGARQARSLRGGASSSRTRTPTAADPACSTPCAGHPRSARRVGLQVEPDVDDVVRPAPPGVASTSPRPTSSRSTPRRLTATRATALHGVAGARPGTAGPHPDATLARRRRRPAATSASPGPQRAGVQRAGDDRARCRGW